MVRAAAPRSPGAARRPRSRCDHARAWPPTAATCASSSPSKADDRADDFASALLAIHDEDPEALTHEEIASILFSLSFAGHETTNNLIGNLVRRLLEEPLALGRGRRRPALIAGAVDEMLRYDTSVPVWRRVTTRPTTLGGVDLPEGAKLFLWLAAAGRDPTSFPEPGPLRPAARERPPPPGVRQGHPLLPRRGLGKLEAQLALEELTRRFPRLRLVAGQEIPFHPNISFRGPLSLWVDPRG